MDTITNTVWQRKGSSFIFDQKSLGPLISDGAVISLRQALSWYRGLPAAPPVTGRTILVSGLETVIETRQPQEAEDFLCRRIRPLLIHLQNHWTDCGVVFGFTSHPKTFEETSFDEEVFFRAAGGRNLPPGRWPATVQLQALPARPAPRALASAVRLPARAC